MMSKLVAVVGQCWAAIRGNFDANPRDRLGQYRAHLCSVVNILFSPTGLSIYFFYGMWKSAERTGQRLPSELQTMPDAAPTNNRHDYDAVPVREDDAQPLTERETESEI